MGTELLTKHLTDGEDLGNVPAVAPIGGAAGNDFTLSLSRSGGYYVIADIAKKFRSGGGGDDLGFRPLVAEPAEAARLAVVGEHDDQLDERHERHSHGDVADEASVPIPRKGFPSLGHGAEVEGFFAQALAVEEGEGITGGLPAHP